MKIKLSLAVVGLLAMLFAGCLVRSLHPLFTEKELVSYSDLAGSWSQDGGNDNSWTFVSTGKLYRLTHVDEKKRAATFLVGVGKIGTNVFLNSSPEDLGVDERMNDFATVHLIAACAFMKVERHEKNIHLVALDPEWLLQQLQQNPKLISHVMREKEAILTATTEELQKFVARFAADTNAFKNTIVLQPKK